MRLVPAEGGGPGRLLAQVDRFLVPIGEPAPMEFFVDRLFVAHGFRERLTRSVLAALSPDAAARLLAGRSHRLWRLAGGGESDDGRGETVPRDRFVRAVELLDAALEPGGDPPAAVFPNPGWILLADYERHRRGGATAFLFPAGSRRPAAVVKLRPAEMRRRESPLAREAEALTEVRRALPAHFSRTLPELLARRQLPTGEALWLGALEGRSAYVEQAASPLPARRVARHLDVAATWLGRFHLATRTDVPCSLPADPGELGMPPGAGTPAWYRDLATDLAQEPVLLSGGHGDFWARNLLLPEDDGGLPGVIDWEAYRQAAPPWEDLFHFVLSYASHHRWLGLRRRPPREAFRRAFLAGGFMFRRVRRYFRRYCAVTGVAPSLLPRLFRLYLLEREASLPAGGGTRPGLAGGEKGFFLWCYLALQGAGRCAFSG